MNESPRQDPSSTHSQDAEDQLFKPEHQQTSESSSKLNLFELLVILWQGKGIILLVTVASAVFSVSYALLATQWYRGEILLAPVDNQSNSSLGAQLGAQLGGLAALAGVAVGGNNAPEALAVLTSREFIGDFIEDYGLLPVLLSDQWDADNDQWRGDDPANWPDVRDGVRLFREKLLKVNENPQTGLVLVSVDWTDPALAAAWPEVLIKRLNMKLRARALKESETNVGFLQGQLSETNVVTLQQSIGRLLESELQKVMLAKGSEEFAFRVIDSTGLPKYRIWPKRAVVSVVGTLLGGVLGVLIVFFLHAFREDIRKAQKTGC